MPGDSGYGGPTNVRSRMLYWSAITANDNNGVISRTSSSGSSAGWTDSVNSLLDSVAFSYKYQPEAVSEYCGSDVTDYYKNFRTDLQCEYTSDELACGATCENGYSRSAVFNSSGSGPAGEYGSYDLTDDQFASETGSIYLQVSYVIHPVWPSSNNSPNQNLNY